MRVKTKNRKVVNEIANALLLKLKNRYQKKHWRIDGLPNFDFSFMAHLEWAK